MTSKEFKAVCERMGFGIAHARAYPKSGEVRAYVAVRNDAEPETDELRWTYAYPDRVELYQHATKSNGYGQYDKFIKTLPLTR